MREPASGDADSSPSLSMLARTLGPAYELKFVINEAAAPDIEEWARQRLSLDPHGQADLGGGYRISTLYLDTPALDVYHRMRSYGRRKFRIRRYGLMTSLFLERKTKSRDRVAKRRTETPAADLARLAVAANGSWNGDWFHQRILKRGLAPASRLDYCRTAWVGECREGPMRLTLDRDVRGALCSQWSLTAGNDGLPLLPGNVILELKFLRAMPLHFKELVRDFRLSPEAVSKYRLCREAWGVSSAAREVAGA